ncbi:MAG: hypothetical protein CMJ25_07445 [Phycisphaerae bacterium]|nr:hypothetical protein [Phycisphaerae bacterium]
MIGIKILKVDLKLKIYLQCYINICQIILIFLQKKIIFLLKILNYKDMKIICIYFTLVKVNQKQVH